MKMPKNKQLLAKIGGWIATLVCFSGVQTANAIEQVSNFSEFAGVTYGGSPTFGIWLSSSFTVDNQDYTLNSVTLRLQEETESPSLFVSIYNDNGGVPGSIVTNGNLNVPDIPSSVFGNYVFSSTDTLNLDANNTYWIVTGFSSNSTGSYQTNATTSDDETSSVGWTIGDIGKNSFNQGSSWSDANFGASLLLSVDATTVSAAVPFEFSPSLGLLLVGGLFGGNHLYRKHKESKVVFIGEE
jgi:hypothetical protein